MASLNNSFQLQWRGEVLIITATGNVDELNWELTKQAAELFMEPIRSVTNPSVLFDLTHIKYMDSAFLALILRCYTLVKSRGGELAICGANEMAAELLRVTALDTLWPIYPNKDEALLALG